jgi:hypothetical protein
VAASALSPMACPAEDGNEINPLFPMTLDLRLPPRGQRAQIDVPELAS